MRTLVDDATRLASECTLNEPCCLYDDTRTDPDIGFDGMTQLLGQNITLIAPQVIVLGPDFRQDFEFIEVAAARELVAPLVDAHRHSVEGMLPEGAQKGSRGRAAAEAVFCSGQYVAEA